MRSHIFETVAERYRADGITALMMMPRSPNVAISGVASAALDLECYAELTASPEVSGTGRDNPEETRGVVTVAGLLEGPEQMADPLLQECIGAFSSANPDIEIPEMRSVEPGDPDVLAAQPYNSLGPGKLDANDTVRLVEFDPEAGPSVGNAALTGVVDATP